MHTAARCERHGWTAGCCALPSGVGLLTFSCVHASMQTDQTYALSTGGVPDAALCMDEQRALHARGISSLPGWLERMHSAVLSRLKLSTCLDDVGKGALEASTEVEHVLALGCRGQAVAFLFHRHLAVLQAGQQLHPSRLSQALSTSGCVQ